MVNSSLAWVSLFFFLSYSGLVQDFMVMMEVFSDVFKTIHRLPGMAALSLLTSGKYVIDPELRGVEFERITQNLDMQFWKSFWNLTESGLITVGRVKYFSTDSQIS